MCEVAYGFGRFPAEPSLSFSKKKGGAVAPRPLLCQIFVSPVSKRRGYALLTRFGVSAFVSAAFSLFTSACV